MPGDWTDQLGSPGDDLSGHETLGELVRGVLIDAGGGGPSPEDFLAGRGIPHPPLVHDMRALREELTQTVNTLLPGAQGAAPWLIAGIFNQLATIPALVPTLEPQTRQHLASAILTSAYLYPIWYELDAQRTPPSPQSRADMDHVHSGTLSPSEELSIVKDTATRQVNRLLGGYFSTRQRLREVRAAQAEMVRGLAAEKAVPYSCASGGWLLLASVYALHEHPLLARPGRKRRRLPGNRSRAAAEGVAFEIGESLALATALGLLEAEAT